jgi:hypothetical protein
MAMYRTATVAAPLTIIGKDLSAYATFNGDTVPALGVLRAGTAMKYTVATQLLSKATIGTDTVFGILADDIDTGPVGTTEVPVVMVYRAGTFLRQEIESANNFAIVPGDANDLALRDKGIYLEQSYEGYVGLSPIPAGVQPLGATKEEEEAGEEARKAQEEAESARDAKPKHKVEEKHKGFGNK